jgi:hypothetical protein
MYQAHVQFPPLLAGAIGRDAPDYERQEQKQRNGVPRPMIRRGFGIVPISVLIRLGHFKSLGFKRRPQRMKYPMAPKLAQLARTGSKVVLVSF